MASLCEDDSTKSNGCRNKQLDKTYKLRPQSEEIVARSGVDECTRSNGSSNKQLDGTYEQRSQLEEILCGLLK